MSTANESRDPLGDRLMGLCWRTPPADNRERVRRRVSVHLIPYLFFLYILAYLDRVNVSVAKLEMTKSPAEGGLGFDDGMIGFGAGLFFWGYWILEIPSTLSVVKWGARWVFVRILVLWGLCATLVGFIGLPIAKSMFSWLPTLPEDVWGLQNIAHYVNRLPTEPVYQFYFFRFMLGFFEGGFFPSVIVYLSLWFRQQDRAKAIALFMAAIPLSSALGTPLSGLLLYINWFGLEGWRWVFIIEGVIPILAGFTTIFFLPDRPRDAEWLSPEDRSWLQEELDREHAAKVGHGLAAWKGHLGMVLLLTFVYFCQNVSSYGLSIFMPSIFEEITGSQRAALVLTTLTYTIALIGMLVNGWHSDLKSERIWHVSVPLFLLGVSVAMVFGVWGSPWTAVAALVILVGVFHYAHLPAFWPIPTMFLGAGTAASAIGFINMIGNLGGFVGPYIVGKKDATSYEMAMLKIAPWPVLAAVIVLTVGVVRQRLAASAARGDGQAANRVRPAEEERGAGPGFGVENGNPLGTTQSDLPAK